MSKLKSLHQYLIAVRVNYPEIPDSSDLRFSAVVCEMNHYNLQVMIYVGHAENNIK